MALDSQVDSQVNLKVTGTTWQVCNHINAQQSPKRLHISWEALYIA